MRSRSSDLLWKDAEEVLSPEEIAALRRDVNAEVEDEGFLQKVMHVMSQGSEVKHEAEALWVLGPSGAGKSHSLHFGHVRQPPGALLLDGALIRETSQAWASAIRLAESKGLAGFSNYFKDHFKVLSDKVKTEVVRSAVASRANVVIPDTASNFKQTASTVEKFRSAGYRISCVAIYADRVTCESRGRLREREEGKKYSSSHWTPSVETFREMQGLLDSLGVKVEILDNTGALHRLDLQQVQERLARDRQLTVRTCWGECRQCAGVYRAEAEDSASAGRLFQLLPWSMADKAPVMELLVLNNREVERREYLQLQLQGCTLRPQGKNAGWLLRTSAAAKGGPELEAEEGFEFPSLSRVSPVPGWSLPTPVQEDAGLLASLGNLDFCHQSLRELSEEEFRYVTDAVRLTGPHQVPSREQPRALLLLAPSGGGKSTVLHDFAGRLSMALDEAVLVDSSAFRDFHAQYRAILRNGLANGTVWYRAWPAAKDSVVAGKHRLLAQAVRARKHVILSDTGAAITKLLGVIGQLKQQGYLVSLCGVFADPAEIVARGVAREVEQGKRYNRDVQKLCASFEAFTPAIEAINGEYCLVRNSQGCTPTVHREGKGGERIQFKLQAALEFPQSEPQGTPLPKAEEEGCAPAVHLPPEDLTWLMEGNANVVCAYRGRLHEWQGRVLRLRKTDNCACRRQCDFAHRVGSRLFGAEFVDSLRLVSLSSANVQAIDEAIASSRPAKRRAMALDAEARDGTGRVLAMSMQNLTAAPIQELPVVSVELKPKCGLVERAGLPSRYQMLQQQKLADGKVSTVSDYDPVKLLSQDSVLVQHALWAALAEPQNNIRVFVDGQLVHSEEDRRTEGLSAGLTRAGLTGTEELVQLLGEVLASPRMALPSRLKRVQAWAAGETCHFALQLYSRLRRHLGGSAADARLGSLAGFELALQHLETSSADESGVGQAVARMCEVHTRACTAEKWTAELEDEVVRELCAFLLGRTAQDVSVILSLVRVPGQASAELDKVLRDQRFLPCVDLVSSPSLAEAGFWLRVSVVDLDTKPPLKIPEYATQLDNAAAAFFYRFESNDKTEKPTANAVPEGAMGGHVGAVHFEGQVVWKQDQGGLRGQTELDFLRWALDEPSCVGIIPELVAYRREGGQGALAMQNLLYGLAVPAILDIKLGTRTWNTAANAEKAESQRRKAAASTSNSLGVRATAGGYRRPDGAYFKVGSKAGREIPDWEGLRKMLSEFLCSQPLRASALKGVQRVRDWWAGQAWFAFYGSSLLLAYDCDTRDECRVRLIDFANCERISDKAEDLSGVGDGFQNLLTLLATLAPLP